MRDPPAALARIVPFGIVFCVTLGSVRAARADSMNPNLVPLGETEAFLGNTGVGRANDSGAVYYNPSGLAELTSGRVSVSGAVYVAIHEHYDSLLNIDNTNIPFDASNFLTIPSAYVATRSLGEWVGAFSILVPDSLEFADHVAINTPNTKGNLIYSIGQNEYWFGLSAARKLGHRWSLGLSVFGIDHSQTSDVAFQEQTATSFSANLQHESLSVWSLSATLGVTFIATDNLRFGARAQTASLELTGSATTFTTAGEDLKGTSASYRMPFDFSVGTAVTPTNWLTFLADVSLQLAGSYSDVPASQLDNQVVLKVTPRLNLGVEMWPAPVVPVRLGFLYNPSANGGDPTQQGYQRDNYYGFTAGIGLNDTHVRTCVGGFYIFSDGEYTSSTGMTAPESTRAVGAMLTTAYVF
jgi:hypothetical protein